MPHQTRLARLAPTRAAPRRVFVRALAQALLLVFLHATAAGAGTPPTVIGPGAGCSVDTSVLGNLGHVQTALQSGATDIRLVVGDYREGITHALRSDIEISGGYASCAAAFSGQASDDQRSRLILRSGGQAVLLISDGDSGILSTLRLNRLDLRPNPAPAPGAISTGLVLSGSDRIVLRDSAIVGFDARSLPGGGIFSFQGRIALEASQVRDNTAASGAGIYCRAGSLSVDSRSAVYGNRAQSGGELPVGADGVGGGIALDDCFAEINARISAPTRPPLRGGGEAESGVIANEASHAGGGIHAHDSTLIVAGGPGCSPAGPLCPNGPAFIASNVTDGHGGGIAMVDSIGEFDYFWIAGNQASTGGGGLHLSGENSLLRLGVVLSGTAPAGSRGLCIDAARCNAIADNRLDSGSASGGGIAATGGSLFADNLFLGGNAGGIGSQLQVTGAATAQFRQLLVEGAGGIAGVLASEGAVLSIEHGLLWDNSPGLVLAATGSAQLQFNNSVVAQLGGGQAIAVATTASGQGSCNAVLGARSAGAIDLDEVDLPSLPLARIAVAGALVDRCPGSLNPLPYDLLGNPRRLGAALDIGPFELGEAVFSDGFEPAGPR
jgi:hypothetical protein